METKPNNRLEDQVVTEVVNTYQNDLFRFMLSILRDEAAAHDAIQGTFAKLLEQGGGVARQSLRSWLFRVAYNIAMEIRRRHSMEKRHLERVAVWRIGQRQPEQSGDELSHAEQTKRVRQAMEALSPEQQEILRLRMYEDLKFVEIAEKLQIPLGTALTRMRAALGKLSSILHQQE